MPPNTQETQQRVPELKTLFDAARKLTAPVPFESDKEPRLVAVPEGLKLQCTKALLDEYRDRPERRSGSATLTSLKSFIDHTIRFKDAGSVVFVNDVGQPSLTSVLDYHEGAGGGPRFGEHRGFYEFPFSDAWDAWVKQSGKWLSQTAFADLIESRAFDLAEPTTGADKGAVWKFQETLNVLCAKPAQMLELSKGLSIYEDSKVIEQVNLAKSTARLGFETEHRAADGGKLEVPAGFVLNLSVFRGSEPFRVPVRLRYRVERDNGTAKVKWWFEIYRTDLIYRMCIDEACAEVATATGLPVLFGSPEKG